MQPNTKQLLYYALIVLVAGSVITYGIVRYRQDRPEDGEQQSKPRISLKENELELLAKAVHAEAKGEPYEGQIAVAAVILNRVEHPEFPNTVAGVIYEPLAFEVVANGTINQSPNEQARQAAYEALHGLDPTGGAIYFYNPVTASSSWIKSRPVMKSIGKHVFAS